MKLVNIMEDQNWWENTENKETFNLPISVIKEGDWWIATCNDETEKYLGKHLFGAGQGKTKEEAIENMFTMIRIRHEYSVECELDYRRFIPFRIGNWKRGGGRWITIFGFQIYFRWGDNMNGGLYIPYTKLNLSFANHWKTYKNLKKQKKSTI